MALAAGGVSYTPPATVRTYIARLSLLPALYSASATVLIPEYCDCPIEQLPYYGLLKHKDMHVCAFRDMPECKVIPWGWNKALKHHIINVNDRITNLPADTQLDIWRDLSHRQTTVSLFETFADEAFLQRNAPCCCMDMDSCIRRIEQLNKEGKVFVAKSCWSSSGRGVFVKPPLQTLQTLLNRGNGVMIEPYWHKVIDFASEWACSAGKVQFKGLSLFQNQGIGKYAYNLVASQQEILDIISRYCSESQLRDVIDLQKKFLESVIAPVYNGPVGIDMLCDEYGNINPGVEINLRMTMGHVALELYDTFGLYEGKAYNFHPGEELPFR